MNDDLGSHYFFASYAAASEGIAGSKCIVLSYRKPKIKMTQSRA